MKLVHYSDKLVTLEKRDYLEDTRQYYLRKKGLLFKPHGLWVSDESCKDDWKTWCEGDEFRLGNLRWAHDVQLHRKANILLINNPKKMEKFGEKYGGKLFKGYIEWENVMRDYDGIIITPYLWEYRFAMNFMWYYSWDCASGCIWNLDAIKNFTLRGEDMKTVAERLRLIRLLKNVSQQELSKSVGIHRSAISMWETGDTKEIGAANLLKAAKKLDVCAYWLCFGSPYKIRPYNHAIG